MKFALAVTICLWAGLVAPLWFLIPFSVLMVLTTPFEESSISGFLVLIIMSSLPLWNQVIFTVLLLGIFYGLSSLKNSLKIPQFAF